MANESLRSTLGAHDGVTLARARRLGLRAALLALVVLAGSGAASTRDRSDTIRLAQRQDTDQGSGEPQQGAVSPPAAGGRPDDRKKSTGPTTPVLSVEEKDQLQKVVAQGQRYIAQGERYLLEGNVGVARQFFQRAADAGYPPGAMRLAATYDPAELAGSQLQGIVPDVSEARRWYERARQLGAPDAAERLARLSRN
jgi:TPR repeat protein